MAKPTLFIIDASVAVTGALESAARQAELLRDAVETILVLPRDHQVPASRTAAFSEVIELPILNLRKSVRGLLFYLPALLYASIRLRRAMRRRRCERLQLNDFYLLHGAVLRLLGFGGRIATFIRIDPRRFGVLGRIWLAAALWCSSELVAVSRFVQLQLGSNHPSRLIYERVADPSVTPASRPKIPPILLFVGNMIEGKGQEHALAAFNLIADRFLTARLHFVGGDMGLDKNRSYQARLREMAAAGPSPGRVEFRGSSDDLVAEYAEAFAVLNFSNSETFSITCLDGSAAGLPVIATRCGGPEEIVEDGETGFLVPIGDIAVMADRMAWLLDHPVQARAFGRRGKELVNARFSASQSSAHFQALFDL